MYLPEQSQPDEHPEELLRSRGRPTPPWEGWGSEWGRLLVPGLQVVAPPAQADGAIRQDVSEVEKQPKWQSQWLVVCRIYPPHRQVVNQLHCTQCYNLLSHWSSVGWAVFFNEEGFDFIGLWTHNVELSMATFVQLIEQIMRKLCSWH